MSLQCCISEIGQANVSTLSHYLEQFCIAIFHHEEVLGHICISEIWHKSPIKHRGTFFKAILYFSNVLRTMHLRTDLQGNEVHDKFAQGG